jgi:hypothetical protein
MKALAVLITLALFMSECKRNEKAVNQPCSGDCTIFKIRVGTDEKAATPVAFMPVELGWEGLNKGFGADPGRLIATGTTNADGVVNFSFKAQSKELTTGYYYVRALSTTDYYPENEEDYFVRKADSVVNSLIHLSSKASVKVIYQNFKPVMSTDNFNIFAYYNRYYNEKNSQRMTMLPTQSFTFSGGPFDRQEAIGATAGNAYTYIYVNRKINGVVSQVKDSIYLNKGEMKAYTVNYQ